MTAVTTRGPQTHDEIRVALDHWIAVRALREHPGWGHIVTVLENDRRTALDLLASPKLKDPFDIGRTRGVAAEAASVLAVVASADREIAMLNSKLEEVT